MKTTSKYQNLIAPCGMNCGICIGYLREKNPCGGCLANSENKPKHCKSCTIVRCEHRKSSKSGFCYECVKFPCTRMKQLDKRYRTRYRMSMLDNLQFIKEKGLEAFLKNEEVRWTCENCGAGFSVHRDSCLQCKATRVN